MSEGKDKNIEDQINDVFKESDNNKIKKLDGVGA